MNISKLAILANIILALFITTGHTATVALDSFHSNGYGTGLTVNVTEGFRFRPNQDIYVQELGFFDLFSDGLVRSYSMGIVDTSSTVLGTATVPSGTTGRLDEPIIVGGALNGSGFRYAALDGGPLHLLSGITYAVVVLLFPGQPDGITFLDTYTTNSAITFLGTYAACCSNPAGTLHYPVQYATGDFAVNFTFTTEMSAVPVPAALPLFSTGLAIMGFMGWRRRRKVAGA